MNVVGMRKYTSIFDTFTSQESSRDEVFDLLKGVALLLVILGHCRAGALYPFIYSFHMPLFFFVSGYFFKNRPIKEEVALSFKRLLVPYFFASFCICSIAAFVDVCTNTGTDFSYTQVRVIRCLLGFRGEAVPDWIDGHVGLLWFIFAMFWARSLVIFLIRKIKSVILLGVVCVALGLFGVFMGERLFVPYCIPQGFSAASFIFVGYLIKRYDLLRATNSKKIIPFLVMIWLYTWRNGGMSMARSFYSSGYIFDLLGALGAFFILHMFVETFFCKESFFWQVVRFLGRFSLVAYMVHSVEYDLVNWKLFATYLHIPFDFFDAFQILTRLILVVLFTFFILKNQLLREKIFQIRT